MVAHEAFIRAVVTPRFWTDLYWLSEPAASYEELVDTISVVVSPTSDAIVVRFDPELQGAELGLKSPEQHEYALGWYDRMHWHSAALRWSEVHRVVTGLKPTAASAIEWGLVCPLLSKFTPVLSDEDARFASALLGESWDSLGVLTRGERNEVLVRLDLRDTGMRWEEVDGVWVLSGPVGQGPIDSLRIQDNEDFPHAPLERLVKGYGVPPALDGGETPARVTSLTVAVPRDTGTVPFGGVEGDFLGHFLDRVLRHLGVGYVSWVSRLPLRGASVDVYRVRTAFAGYAVGRLADSVSLLGPGRQISLVKDAGRFEEVQSGGRLYCQLVNLAVERRGASVVVVSRPLSTRQKQFVARLAEQQRLAQLTTSVGVEVVPVQGVARVEGLDGLSVWFERWSHDVAEAVFSLGADLGLCFVPPVVVLGGDGIAGDVDEIPDWVHRVSDAAELYELVSECV